MPTISPPEPQELIPPVLACLPTAFVSPRPPPALLPLLSPILRQRLHLLTSTSSGRTNKSSNWLELLTYSTSRANRLIQTVGDMQLEPHPVSGELELFTDGEDPQIKYRRRDKETLHACCMVKQHLLAFVWVWCVRDQGGTGLEALEDAFGGGSSHSGHQLQPKDGWRLAEILPWDDVNDEDARMQWYQTMAEANEAESRNMCRTPGETKQGDVGGTQALAATSQDSLATSDDEDYWASYDMTPGRTPGRSPGVSSPPLIANGIPRQTNGETRGRQLDDLSTSDSDYYSRYSTEVQPALDSHDPQEEIPGIDSTLRGEDATTRPSINLEQRGQDEEDDYTRHQFAVSATEYANFMQPTLPKPISNIDKGHIPVTDPPMDLVEAFPYDAENKPIPNISPIERAVSIHIAAEIKSLYRLARGAGLEKLEFERLVSTELELLDLLQL